MGVTNYIIRCSRIQFQWYKLHVFPFYFICLILVMPSQSSVMAHGRSPSCPYVSPCTWLWSWHSLQQHQKKHVTYFLQLSWKMYSPSHNPRKGKHHLLNYQNNNYSLWFFTICLRATSSSVSHPRVLIFCRTISDCANIYEFFHQKLGHEFTHLIGTADIYFHLVDMYTSVTTPGVKEQIQK